MAGVVDFEAVDALPLLPLPKAKSKPWKNFFNSGSVVSGFTK